MNSSPADGSTWEGLTSHVFAAKDATEAYAAANRDRATTMGLIIDWTGELKDKK